MSKEYTKEEKKRIMKLTGWSEEEFETATTMIFMDKEIFEKERLKRLLGFSKKSLCLQIMDLQDELRRKSELFPNA